MLSIISRLVILGAFALSLTGCIAAAAGAGVAGGVYLEKHYKVVKKDKKSKSDDTKKVGKKK